MMGIETTILTAHMRSVEYILTAREKRGVERRKGDIIASCT